jgi:peptidoglycan/xylan/chitin deacetylase (PgdA/CDA1 family)
LNNVRLLPGRGLPVLVACAALLVTRATGAKPHHHAKVQTAIAEVPVAQGGGAELPPAELPFEAVHVHHGYTWPVPAAGPTRSGDPELLFTFDDGPNPETTPAVLDILAKYHVHAVFFVVGRRVVHHPEAPAIIQRMLREGHIVANHTMHHQDLCRDDEAGAAREIDDGRRIIERAAAGFVPVWFRSPYGARCARVDRLLDERHLQHFHWDLDPQEWRHGDTKSAIAYVEQRVGKMTGRSVLLMHDVKHATVKALPVILDWIATENAKRELEHRRPIRIVQSYDLAIDRLPPGLAAWFRDATPDLAGYTRAFGDALP